MFLNYVVTLGSFIHAGAIVMRPSANTCLSAVPSCGMCITQCWGRLLAAATSLPRAAVPLCVTGKLKTTQPRGRF